MNRRELLGRAGVFGAVGVAGCLGSATPDDREPNGAGTTDPGTTTDANASDPDEPFRTVTVGSRDGVAFPENNRPHDVHVRNDADERREIAVELSRGAEMPIDRTVAFPADARLALVLAKPADYRLKVGVAGEEPTGVTIERSRFDCNASRTTVRVLADGEVESVTESTQVGCPGPEVAATDFSHDRGECGTDDRASVAFDGERVRIEGAVRTATPGEPLELAGADYDADEDALTVRVRVGDDGDGIGVQCVGEVPYEATVEFDHALPGEVVVVHERDDESVEVTRERREGG